MLLRRPLLILLAGCLVAATQESVAVGGQSHGEEPSWGRIYLRRGLSPIQYFRDNYGGPMVTKEVEFYFPRRTEDRLGCEPLQEDEQDIIRAANGSIAIVVDRGVCSFEIKSRLAEQAGAAALVVISEDESVIGPVATTARGEIKIVSIMVRKSAGDMLRSISTRERVFGRLVPIVCERNPYVCKAVTRAEAKYVDDHQARSGRLIHATFNTTFGTFLAATFGSVLPTRTVRLPVDVEPIDGCEELDTMQLSDGVALFSALQGQCSILEKVSTAQRAGATVALLAVGELPVGMKHPSVAQSWHAYNITIAAAAISSSTLERLVAVQQELRLQGETSVGINLDLHNQIADGWDEVRRLSVKAAWPTRKDRKEKLLEKLIGSFHFDDSQLLELKNNFITIAGGSGSAWNKVLRRIRLGTLAEVDVDPVNL